VPDPARNTDLRRSFASAFAARLDLAMTASELTPTEEARAADLERDRYSTEAWNRMR